MKTQAPDSSLDKGRFFCQTRAMNWSQRVEQLLHQLEVRARQCPGLYPVQTAGDFLRIVADALAESTSANTGNSEETAAWLEQLWRHPELTYQLNAQSLIRRGASPFGPSPVPPNLKDGTG